MISKRSRELGWHVGVPDLSKALPARTGVDAEAFRDWLAPHLDRFREQTAVRSAYARPSENLAEIRKHLKHATKLAELLSDLAPVTAAHLNSMATSSLTHDLPRQLKTLAIVIPELEKRFPPPRPGAPNKRHRDELLALVVAKLRETMSGKAADGVAADILKACGLGVIARTSVKEAKRKGKK